MAQDYRLENDSLGPVKVPAAALYGAQPRRAREIGYSKAAEIAKRAYREGRPLIDVAIEMTDLDAQRLAQLLDPGELV